MAEPIFSTWVTSNRDTPFVLAGYLLMPQVKTFVNVYKFSDLKTLQRYGRMNVIQLNDDPSMSSGIGTGLVSSDTPQTLDTVTEIAAQLTFTKVLKETDFSETGTGTGKWKTTIEHKFGRLPKVNIVYNNSVIQGDVVHDDKFTYFVLTLSQRIPCTVHLS